MSKYFFYFVIFLSSLVLCNRIAAQGNVMENLPPAPLASVPQPNQPMPLQNQPTTIAPQLPPPPLQNQPTTTAPEQFGTQLPPPQAERQADATQFQNWINQAGATPPPPATVYIPPPPLKKKVVRTKIIEKKPHIYIGLKGKRGIVTSPPLSYEESQKVMLKQVPPSPLPRDEDAEIAFNGLLKQNVPLTPEQVVRLRQYIDLSQRAASIPPTVPPKPISSTLMINLATGTTPPAIRIAQGYVSTLVFVDSLGSPWPIASYDIGDPKATTIQWDGKSNILLIQGISPYSDSNFVVRLVGLLIPITLELVSGQRVVDFRTDIHVPGIGPNSKDLAIVETVLPESASTLLLGVLDGVAPPGSKQLTVKGGDGQAWLLGDKLYFRSRMTVLSPGWVGKMSSPDGMMAYELPRTSSILISLYGEPFELKIEGF